MRILPAWLILKLLKIKTYNKTKKNQAYRFIRRFGAVFRTRTILGFTRACCKWMLRVESFTKRLKIFNFSRAYNHHVIFKQPIKTKQNWRALGLNTFTRFHPPFSPPVVTSLFRFEQSAATRLIHRPTSLLYHMAVFNREHDWAAKLQQQERLFTLRAQPKPPRYAGYSWAF